MTATICSDLARELLKKLVVSTVKDGDLVCAVRSLKTFRAVNVSFRDAFEEDKMGVKTLARYLRKLVCMNTHRIGGIENLIHLQEREWRHFPHQRGCGSNGAIGWVRELRLALQRDVNNHKKYLAALNCEDTKDPQHPLKFDRFSDFTP